MNCGPPPPNQLLPNLHWEHSMNPLSSIITSSPAPPAAISGNTGNSLNSMPTKCLMPFPTDPGFTERAAKYSCFSSGNCGASFTAQFGILGTGKQLSRVSSSQSLKAKVTPIESREDSSITDPGLSPVDSNARKRKAAPKSKAKVVEENGLNAKKCRSPEAKEEQNGEEKQGKDDVSKLPEPSKDYIHVRARRGQATDSHSLAERVRREKISQRMQLLQDIVPGCNKITGKALMLDEIINYVQSLQRQVEFLSMKLATVNPRLGCNLDNFISKEPLMSQANASLPSSVNPLDNLAMTFPFSHQFKEGKPLHFGVTNGMETHCSVSQFDSNLHQTPCMQPTSLDVFGAADSQLANLWDDELRSIVQMSLVQNQEVGLTSPKTFMGNCQQPT